MDKSRWESNLKAIQNFETKLDTTHAELREEIVTKEHLSELLPNRQDVLTRWEKPVAGNKALLKASENGRIIKATGDAEFMMNQLSWKDETKRLVRC